MEKSDDPNEKLFSKIEDLIKKQEILTAEIIVLKNQIYALKQNTNADQKEGVVELPNLEETKTVPQQPINVPKRTPKDSILIKGIKKLAPDDLKDNIEKFVGENLISVIGVIILIIGVGIGAKYAIDHKMISPLTRIIIGYIIAIGLLGFAIKLKAKYESYSAVLLSGALAIMYFLTFAAYDFYDLIPKMMAFGLMVVFTAFTTLASIKYNKQVIAHIGFVGAYAVPFLLSDGSGSVIMLFSYIVIINIGILAVSLKNYWKSLYYTAFAFTWIIFVAAGGDKLDATEDLATLLTFLTSFYLTFYAVFIGYKLIREKAFIRMDILLLMSNSFVFYGLGYAILSETNVGGNYLGLFTLINAIIHFGVASYINKKKLADRNLFYLIIGLVLTFITIAIPVQLNGHWVTLLWVGEATLLFWIGRAKKIAMYEKLSYPLIAIAFVSVFEDWDMAYGSVYGDQSEYWLTPIFNFQFLSSLIALSGFGIINFINQKIKIDAPIFTREVLNKIFEIVVPAFFLILLYMSFSLEITNYWDQQYYSSKVMLPYEDGSGDTYEMYNYSIKSLASVWSLVYALFFFTTLSIVNYKILKNRLLGLVNLGINGLVLVLFLTSGLFFISELRGDYLTQEHAEYFSIGWMYIGIRYLSLMFLAGLVYASYEYSKQEFLQINLKQVFALVFYTTVLWLLSSELIHWMDYVGSTQSYKLGLSILWGVYSLVLIVIGIFRKYKQVRLGAMGLFGITLFKLFFYDISHLDTIAKTIVFIVLGVLLLVVSFLYNKYKYLIFNDGDNKE
jgi:uncharacterized membrane protein